MPNDVDTLVEMGFSKNKAEKALHKTGYKGPEVAMEWLFAHSEDPDTDEPFELPKGYTLNAEPKEEEKAATQETTDDDEVQAETDSIQAKSIKCEDCGKLMKSELDVQAHAARTQHSNFSESTEEIKPLTEEEKKAQLEKIQERIKQKRIEKGEQEKKDQLEREKNRRKTGKEVINTKQKLEEMELKKIAAERRKAKLDDKLARQKVKEQIEKDKADRATKFARKSDPQTANNSAASNSAASNVATATDSTELPVKKEYDQARIQIRLTNGQSLTQSFGSKECLGAVKTYIQMNRSDGDGAFNLMTSFPRKVFTDDNMEMPLSELGLVPSAVLIVTKSV